LRLVGEQEGLSASIDNAKKTKWLEGERNGREESNIDMWIQLPRVIHISETANENR
jgi:hypothetical protein